MIKRNTKWWDYFLISSLKEKSWNEVWFKHVNMILESILLDYYY